MVGQSGTAVAGAPGVARSRGAAHARPYPDRDLARHTGTARREQIKVQVALITPLIHIKGYAAAETRAAAEQARLLIAQAEALGEPPEDPLLLFSALYGLWVANYAAFSSGMMSVAIWRRNSWRSRRSKRATFPLITGHRLMGISLLFTGDIAEGRRHFDQAIALYDPAEHRPLTTRFGQDVGVATLSNRSWALWLLGYPDAALRDADDVLKNAREIGQTATLMFALNYTVVPHSLCGNYAAAALPVPKPNSASSVWPKKKVPCLGRQTE